MDDSARIPQPVLFPFVGDSVGGSHISALDLIVHLPEQGFTPVIGLHQTQGPLAALLQDRQIPFLTLPSQAVVRAGSIPAEFLRAFKAAVTIRQAGLTPKPVLVHTNDARMHITWLLAARALGAKHIWHQRTAVSSRRLSLFTAMTGRVLTISEYCRSTFPPDMRNRSVVVDEPIDVASMDDAEKARQRAALLQEIGLPPDTLLIGFVGNLTAQKRPNIMVELARAAPDIAGRPACFLLVGAERDYFSDAERATLAPLLDAKRLVLLGPRFPSQPYIAGFDMLIAPGVHEGLGRTVVEAMLLRTPVIAAADGGHCEIIQDGENGLLVQPDDPVSFLSALQTALQDPSATASRAEGAAIGAKSRFSPNLHAMVIARHYRAMI